MRNQSFRRTLVTIAFCGMGLVPSRGDEPLIKFVSVPDFINMDLQLDDPRLFDLTAARQAALVAEIGAGGPQANINPNVGNFIGTVENGYRGASQVLLEALAAENADFFTVSGDLLYTRWPKSSQLSQPGAAQHIRDQADIYYDDWIANVANHAGFDLSDVYTIVGDHEIGDNDWGTDKRPLIPVYKEVYVDKVGNESTLAQGAYVAAPAGFEGRTYAVQRGNLLLVGLDQFETFNAAGNYTQVGSQIASVKVDVTGTQLAWLDSTLTQADADPSINHVIVLAHAPVAGPNAVKVQHSSGLRNATGEDGPLWQTLAAHDVDLFLPGEVHDISMQLADDVLQVVTGTNIFQPSDQPGASSIGFNLNSPRTSEQNYMLVEVYQDRIDLTIKQIETKIWGNHGFANDPLNDAPYKNRETRVASATAEAGFQVTGTITIDTSGGSPVYRNRTGLFLSEFTFNPPPMVDVNIDLNGDGAVNELDALAFIAGLHTDLSGLSLAAAFTRGDVNGDLRNDHLDFRLFKSSYEFLHGGNAFQTALAVPEPTCGALFAVAALIRLCTIRPL